MHAASRPLIIGCIVLISILLLSGAALWSLSRPGAIIVGSKNFTESRLLAEIMAQVIEREAGLSVERKELGSTTLCWGALKTGAIHLYPEYSGTVLADILKQTPLGDPVAAMVKVREAMPDDGEIVAAQPFGLNDTYVLAMRRDEAKRLGITRISDLGNNPDLTAGFTSEFNQRQDGWLGLSQHYRLKFTRPPVDLAPGHMYQAVRDGQVALISAFSTDARIRQFNLVTLEDDRQFFPAYEAIPLMRSDIVQKYPRIKTAMGKIAGRINDMAMMELNHRVDLGGEPIAHVASEFVKVLLAHEPMLP